MIAIAGAGLLALKFMYVQATNAAGDFNATIRPQLEAQCQAQTEQSYTALVGRDPDRAWIVRCGTDSDERVISVPRQKISS